MKKDPVPLLAMRVRQDPDDLFSRFALALELLKRDQAGKAKTLFRSILAKDPAMIGAYYHLGRTLERLGEADEARATYREGIRQAKKVEDHHAKNELSEALAMLDMELEDVEVKGVELEGTEVEGVELEGAVVEGTEVEGTEVEGAVVEGTEVEGAEVENTKMEEES